MRDRGAPELRVGKAIPMAGGRGAFHSEIVFFENLSVPRENRLGREGDGFAIAMQCLDAGRINWAADCVGRRSSRSMRRSTTSRRGGNSAKPFAKNQGIQWMLGDMAARPS